MKGKVGLKILRDGAWFFLSSLQERGGHMVKMAAPQDERNLNLELSVGRKL